MYELALFAGAGGGILGGKILGWRTVCAVEIERYPAGVLMQRQNDGALHPFPVWTDIRSFTKRNNACRQYIKWLQRNNDRLVISGGFPCQDISVAGKGEGITGEKSGLWGEMWRLFCEIRPASGYVENSPMLTSRGIDTVLGNLAAVGYDAIWGVLGADDLGANHRRKRIWILAIRRDIPDSDKVGLQAERSEQQTTGDVPNPESSDWGLRIHQPGQERETPNQDTHIKRSGKRNDTNPHSTRCQKLHAPDFAAKSEFHSGYAPSGTIPDPAGIHAQGQHYRQGEKQPRGGSWWATEPGLGRVVNGMADRVDRLKGIGNGQVPHVAAGAYTLLNYIMERHNAPTLKGASESRTND